MIRSLLSYTRSLLSYTRSLLPHTRSLLSYTRSLLSYAGSLLQASAMGYQSVKAFLRAEKKEAAAAHAQAVKEAIARRKVSFVIY